MYYRNEYANVHYTCIARSKDQTTSFHPLFDPAKDRNRSIYYSAAAGYDLSITIFLLDRSTFDEAIYTTRA